MRWTIASMALFSLVVLASACGESGPSKTELVGTWHATKIQYVSTTGLGEVDIMTLGAGITLQLNDDGTGVMTFTRVSGQVDVMPGTWEGSVDVLSFKINEQWQWQWDMSMSGTQLHLDSVGTSWDFNNDGRQEDADWHLVLTK